MIQSNFSEVAGDKSYQILWRAPVTSNQHCVCCSEPFPKHRALIVQDKSGQQHPMLASCAEAQNIKAASPYIPDFSTILALPPAVLPPHLASQQLFPRQESVLKATLLRTRALPTVGVDTQPSSAMIELANRWDSQDNIPDKLWTQVGAIVENCNKQSDKSGSLATPDLLVVLAVQPWLQAALDTHKIKGSNATIVKSMKKDQADWHNLTHRQFTYLKDLTRPSGIAPPPINGHYLRDAAPKKHYAHN